MGSDDRANRYTGNFEGIPTPDDFQTNFGRGCSGKQSWPTGPNEAQTKDRLLKELIAVQSLRSFIAF